MKKFHYLTIAALLGLVSLAGCSNGGNPTTSGSQGTTGTSTTSGSHGTSGTSTTSGTKPSGEGFDPSWLDEGYSYSSTFPKDAISQFLGAGTYEVLGFDDLPGGCYYLVYEETEEYAACVEVIVDGIRALEYGDLCLENGWDKVFDTGSGIEAVDPTLTYTVATMCSMDEETWEDAAPTFIDFYKSSDVWEDGTLTTDTAWNLEHVDDYSLDYIDQISSVLEVLPFVQMGQNYIITYEDNEIYRWMGYDIPDDILICDYCLVDTLSGYDDLLLILGFNYDDEFDCYFTTIGTLYLEVYFGWSTTGNTITVYSGLAPLNSWPTDQVNDFVTNNIGSKFTIPVYTETVGAQFTFETFIAEDDKGELFDVAEISVDHVKFEEPSDYAEKCLADGYSVEYYPETSVDYPSWYLEKGKICMVITFVQDYDEETEEYSQTDGSLLFDIYGFEGGIEERGIYFDSDSYIVSLNGTLQLEPFCFDLGEDPIVNYVVEDDSVVSVTEDGLVTGLKLGETTITASVEYEGTTYSKTIGISVVDFVKDELTLDKLGVEAKTVYKDFANIQDQSNAKYSGNCAGGSGTIQIRSKTDKGYSGVYSSTSGGKILSVTLNFADIDTNSHSVKIVASNEPFTSTQDLYSAEVITEVYNETGSVTYEFTEDYAYVGVISGGGAHYFDSIEFVWGK